MRNVRKKRVDCIAGEFPFGELQKLQQRKKLFYFKNYRVASPCRFEELPRRIEFAFFVLIVSPRAKFI